MNISIKKTLICLVLFLSFLLIGCSNIMKSDADEIVIKVGEFTVDRQQYENQLKKLTTISDELTQEEAALFLLDNYISAGLLVEAAKKLNYEQRADFIEPYSTYKKQLIIKYSKYLRANPSKLHRVDERLIKKIMQNDIKIDYVRIPKAQEELSKSMFLYFTNGSSIEHILIDPLATEDDKGLSFYENISLTHAILTDKVVEEIMTMQDGEVKLIKANSAYYVVRFLQSKETPIRDIIDNEPIMLNLLQAQSLENGDDIFDPYRFEKSIQCNERLLSRLDFSIGSFHTDGDFIAEICGRFINENDIKEKISELPVKIQSLFVNKTTQVRAIATLILLNYYQKEKPEKVSDWLQPYKLNGYNQLKFDFGKIDSMEITQKNTIGDQTLAYSDNWNLTVKEFYEELDKLTPMTRLDIANGNLLREMIEYLAKRSNVPNSKLIINSNLFESIDVMGKSYDQLNYVFDENTIVGTLGNTDLSVKELREAVFKLSEYEKNRFLDLSTRKESFNEIIADKFWLNLYDRKTIEDNPDFRKEILNYQKKLLVELLYEHELQVSVPQIDDERLNLKMQQDAKSISEDNLFSYIQTIMQDYPIQVNSDFFQKNLNLDIGTSKYNKVIIKNIN